MAILLCLLGGCGSGGSGGVVPTASTRPDGASSPAPGSSSSGGSSATVDSDAGGDEAAPPDGASNPVADGGSPGGCQPSTCGSHKWACWPMPNAADSGLPNPAHYTDLGNGAVLDDLTCLVWQKTENSPAAGSFDAGMPGTMADNQAYCAGLATSRYAGFDDWRLPTRVEVASLLDLAVKPGTGDAYAAVFGKEKTGYYRTSSLWYETIAGINGSMFGWIYNMGSGLTSNAYAQSSAAYARCVRGNGAGEALMQQAVEPSQHYSIATGEVTDRYTNLTWQQGYSSSSMPWSSAAGYCSSLSLDGRVWRVPSLGELSTLVDEARVSPAINAAAFPDVVSCGSTTWFWASEALAGSSTYDWGINFCDGYTGANNAASATAWNAFTAGYVRCVR